MSPEKILVIDSRTATFELGLLFTKPSVPDEGKSAAEIAELLRGHVKRVRLMAVVDTAQVPPHERCRTSTTTAFVGGLLGITPLIAIVDGSVVSTASRGV